MEYVHFIGIEGIGTSAAAQILLDFGLGVSGSDIHPGELSKKLYRKGATIYRGHGSNHLSRHTDTVIASAAIMEDNPELKEAKRRGLKVLYYAELLGWLMSQRRGIAVAGTHGKTTTSGMLAHVLREAGLDPSFVIGGNIPQLNGNGWKGEGEFFVAEACEYNRSFLNLTPELAIITNIEADHLDYYQNLDEIYGVFGEFANLLPKRGVLVAEKRAAEKMPPLQCDLISYSIDDESAMWTAEIVGQATAGNRFVVKKHGQYYGVFENGIPGRHNVSNALGVIALADFLSVPIEPIQRALSSYCGAQRRFDVLVENPITVIDDYAHHPTEIRAVLQATRERFPFSRLWCVFQPHQASRTYHLLNEFAEAFSQVEEVIVPRIYYARDTAFDRGRISSADLVSALRNRGQMGRYIPHFHKIIDFLSARWQSGDVVLCMGAGNICQLSRSLAEQVRKTAGVSL